MVGVPAALSARQSPCVAPRRRWTLLGGLATAPSFASIPAASVLGVQGTSLAMIAGSIVTALALDVCVERSARLDVYTVGSVALVYAGVCINAAGAADTLGSTEGFGALALLYAVLSALAGAGYAVEHTRIHAYVDPPAHVYERPFGKTNRCGGGLA